jgi:Rod binding domain-containing protein
MVSNSLPIPESAGSTHHGGRSNPNQSAVNVAQDFESVFASMLVKEMRQSLGPESLFGEDSGDVYGGLFDRFMGEQMTSGQGLGMARMVQQSIERMENGGKRPEQAASLPPVAAPVSATVPEKTAVKAVAPQNAISSIAE